ncbi:MAG: DegT/DnrJ/EryC1/StrS family aminotransferase [Stappiaceae bacterium]
MNTPKMFTKPFTQQEPVSEEAIQRVSDILRSGRLHRYNIQGNEQPEATLLEEDYAAWQGSKYCVAVTSGGQALQIALRAAGVTAGTPVLANAYTLAPVPGAIFATGGRPILVEIDDNWHTDIADLRLKAQQSGAKIFLLSHMRGHIADMDAVLELCNEFGITLIEDCAHTMGARWQGKRSGNFGHVACFSAQTYKHINSGEGGLLTTDDPELAARSVICSGSYMLYAKHGARPDEEIFRKVRLDNPNCSARLDNVRAALMRAQLAGLEENIRRWNARYSVFQTGFKKIAHCFVPDRADHEEYVGSSFQFQLPGLDRQQIPALVAACGDRGVEIKWFGADEPVGFTSRFDSWGYLGTPPDLPQTKRVLSNTCDIRVPLTFDEQDCALIVAIVAEEVERLTST